MQDAVIYVWSLVMTGSCSLGRSWSKTNVHSGEAGVGQVHKSFPLARLNSNAYLENVRSKREKARSTCTLSATRTGELSWRDLCKCRVRGF